jgi:hypothetical protein
MAASQEDCYVCLDNYVKAVLFVCHVEDKSMTLNEELTKSSLTEIEIETIQAELAGLRPIQRKALKDEEDTFKTLAIRFLTQKAISSDDLKIVRYDQHSIDFARLRYYIAELCTNSDIFNGKLDSNRVVEELSKDKGMAGDINFSMECVLSRSRIYVDVNFTDLRDQENAQ